MESDKLKKLLEQRKIIEARIRQEQNRDKEKQRKDNTRRKILVGAWALDEAANRADFKEFLYKKLDSFLSKPEDRALFSLAPLPGTEPQKEKPAE